jgi:hypothetical protein
MQNNPGPTDRIPLHKRAIMVSRAGEPGDVASTDPGFVVLPAGRDVFDELMVGVEFAECLGQEKTHVFRFKQAR